jgi:ribosomal protein S18 acetylase RimI-like enzyme
MAPEDWPAVQRLHKYAKDSGRPVFAYGPDMEAALKAATCGQQGAFGWVASLPGSSEVLGALTAEQEQDQEGGGVVVLLTVVVRADVRGGRLGEQLVGELLRCAQSKGARRVVADVAVANGRAWGFFLRLGFTRAGQQPGQSFEVELRLPGAASPGAAGGSGGAGRQAPASCRHSRQGGTAGGGLQRHHGASRLELRRGSGRGCSSLLGHACRLRLAAAGGQVVCAASRVARAL